ncbi:MAG: glycosyltransferase, partial [Planctomycetaceae bacterium]
RLLLISYHFPPVGGAGVQRPLKFVKFLRRFGWETTVLTAENPSVPVFDESLLAEIPAEATLLKARTWEPSYRLKGESAAIGESAPAGRRGWKSRAKQTARNLLKKTAGIVLQPDPQILWSPNAYRTACEYLKHVPHDAILTTAPPYSNLLLGCRLKQQFDLPLVADFRDEWDLSSQYLENGQRDVVSQFVQRRMQHRVLRSADLILATTQASTHRLRERAETVNRHVPVQCIYNGYDDDDFAHLWVGSVPSKKTSDRFRIVYTGTLWNLTSVEPIVRAFEELQRTAGHLTEQIEFVAIGRKTPEQLALLERLRTTGCRLIVKDYCSHGDAISEMQSADALCLLLSDLPGAERVAPAKLFEYLALEKPVFAVVPEGETSHIVRSVWPEHCFAPHEVHSIAEWLRERAARPNAVLTSIGTEEDRQRFRRDFQAKQLATALDHVCAMRTE